MHHSLMSYAVAAISGTICGSLLNSLAERTLQGSKIWSMRSECASCGHELKAPETVPIVSYLLLRGCCRHCKSPIHWQYPLVELLTAAAFVTSFFSYGLSLKTIGMDYLACILITLCITDLRQRLIPHALTYPSIVLGLFYSTAVRHELLGSLAGIGISYTLFDFVAFYGQTIYMIVFPADQGQDYSQSVEETEQVDVVGGGDAVLGALIASFLGWEILLDALFFSMIVGGVMAASYRVLELYKGQMIGQIVKPAIIGFTIGFMLIAFCFAGFAMIFSLEKMALVIAGWLALALTVGIGGSLSVIVLARFKKAKCKTFPLAPALAIGAVIALFCDPIGAIVRGGS